MAVISEIGGLTAGAVQLSRQTVIHPHSKNIGIHASRNASLVRALMSVSRKLCARWENEKILRGNLGHGVSVKRNHHHHVVSLCRNVCGRNFGKSAPVSKRIQRWTSPLIYPRSYTSPRFIDIFTVIFSLKFHSGKFHVSLVNGTPLQSG